MVGLGRCYEVRWHGSLRIAIVTQTEVAKTFGVK